ncbi:homeobox prox 1 [Lynx pardinus]|uniref:RNA transcription, translation and transport factor protein n=1 Tax=Lynx pardinus TaxID=191816 RepID=A0A485NB23_LYNPA|nr:homeobox prox 1 [Lynx pardinus]
MALANRQIHCHDDYLLMLKAIHIVVQEYLRQDAAAKTNETKEDLPVALHKHILGFDRGNAVLNEAAQKSWIVPYGRDQGATDKN